MGPGSPAVLLVVAAADGSQVGHTVGSGPGGLGAVSALWTLYELVWCSQETTCVRLLSAARAGCARVEEFPLLRRCARAVRIWKSGHFSFALVSFSPRVGVWVLPVENSVLDISGDPACSPLGSTVDTCSSRGFGRIFHIFYVAVNSNPDAFHLHSRRMESVHSRVALSAVRTLTLDILSKALQMAVCGNFRCVV